MAEIRPFLGLRYRPQAGSLDTLTAPPYDVLSPAQREAYAAKNPFNIVQLTLPEAKEDDRSKYIKYARSAATLSEWRREGTLAPEAAPAFYRYIQKFAGQSRTALIALIKVEPYDKGVVLPHEQTFPKHKEDRLRILEATRSHLECIFGLYEDPASEVLRAIEASDATGSFTCDSEDGVHQILEPITDPEAIATIQRLLVDKTVWIADGHHRYETALNFRAAQGEKDGPIAEDYMMMALTSMSDPGLILQPTHRILKQSSLSAEEILAKLVEAFELTETSPSSIGAEIQAAETHTFGVILPGQKAYRFTPKDVSALIGQQSLDDTEALRALDVSILHRIVLESLLGVKGLDSIAYTRDPQEAVDAVRDGAVASFLMVPPTVEDMRVIALGGEKMPQKSTYYFPKILSGLVLWSLNDF